ncbi:MAG: phosphatidate cytidylyltransferase [Bacteroidales bacterium]|nr:phosphatidate cytidylyltransferase [Bacteroidales bacterium]
MILAKRNSDLKNIYKRTITGVLLVIIILAALWLHPVSYILLGAVLLAGSLYEYYKLVARTGVSPRRTSGLLTAGLSYMLCVLVALGKAGPSIFIVLILPVFFIMAAELQRKKENHINNLANTFFGVLYIALPFCVFPFMAFNSWGPETSVGVLNFNPQYMLAFFMLSWSFDTGAYIFGSWLGKHKLLDRISPEKTWEGFFAGFIISLLTAWLISGWITWLDLTGWLIVAVIISAAGTTGDLIESLFKRNAGVKDSGALLPGHGGVLDRFDSLIISLPLVYVFLVLFG